ELLPNRAHTPVGQGARIEGKRLCIRLAVAEPERRELAPVAPDRARASHLIHQPELAAQRPERLGVVGAWIGPASVVVRLLLAAVRAVLGLHPSLMKPGRSYRTS